MVKSRLVGVGGCHYKSTYLDHVSVERAASDDDASIWGQIWTLVDIDHINRIMHLKDVLPTHPPIEPFKVGKSLD